MVEAETATVMAVYPLPPAAAAAERRVDSRPLRLPVQAVREMPAGQRQAQDLFTAEVAEVRLQ